MGCGGEECVMQTVSIPFQESPNAPGLFLADVATDRCGGDGSEEFRYEVECEGNCPAFTARVFLDAYMIAEEPSTAPYTEIVAHESHTPDINEYQLYVEMHDAEPGSYYLEGRFTGSEAQVLP
jgi:hypothetical protein